jgi:hypothetical protein
MKIHNIYLKTLGLFFIFYTGVSGESNSYICKQIKNNKYIPFKKRIIHYGCKNNGLNNPYVVFAKDILRKYIYIFNVVVIYILLNI